MKDLFKDTLLKIGLKEREKAQHPAGIEPAPFLYKGELYCCPFPIQLMFYSMIKKLQCACKNVLP